MWISTCICICSHNFTEYYAANRPHRFETTFRRCSYNHTVFFVKIVRFTAKTWISKICASTTTRGNQSIKFQIKMKRKFLDNDGNGANKSTKLTYRNVHSSSSFWCFHSSSHNNLEFLNFFNTALVRYKIFVKRHTIWKLWRTVCQRNPNVLLLPNIFFIFPGFY